MIDETDFYWLLT